MKRKINVALLATSLITVMPIVTFAQAPRQAQAIASSDVLSQISMFSYRDGPKSDLFLRGTPIAALAEGAARVEYQDGNAEISAKVEKLPEPSMLGPYTVYVLWALTPDGRAVNQGVIAGSEGGKGNIDTEYGASQFALIVTAEPHFAVTVPSSMIALYNVADNVKGTQSKVTTLTERSDYSGLARLPLESDSNEIVQARYALAIASAAGAERFASQAYMQAKEKLMAAETAGSAKRRSERKMAPQLAREAVVAGEDARRAAMIGSAAADVETQRTAAAETAATAATAIAAVERESTRIQTESDRERAAATAASDARTDLRNRLNTALPTRVSARGLIADIGGVQFATGNAIISEAAREGVAKFTGIVASYPDLHFSVEGHTDSTGSVATNNALSLQRAMSVRDYLVGQGIPASSIDVAGFGSSMPSSDNSTADGRARNRRVEIVVSGGLLAAN